MPKTRSAAYRATIARLDREATVYATGSDVPQPLYVSRCAGCAVMAVGGGCGRAFCWKSAAARPACPICGGVLRTTTRALQRAFTLLDGRLLELAELEPNGLELRARDAERRAERRPAQAAKLRATARRYRTRRARIAKR